MTSTTTEGFPIAGLRSVEFTVPDPEAAARFYTGPWGLVDAATRDGCIYLRGTGTDPYILSLERGARTAITSVTYRAAPGTDLAALRDRVAAAGGTDIEPIGAVSSLGGGTGFGFRERGTGEKRNPGSSTLPN